MGTGSSKEQPKEEQPKEEQPKEPKEPKEEQLKLLEQEMKKVGITPVEKKQKEIEYYKLFYQIYKYSSTKQTLISEEQYDQHMRKLYDELDKLKKQEELEGWDPPQRASVIEMTTYPNGNHNGGKKKSKSKKSKLKKSKLKKSKSKKSKGTKKQ